MSYSIINGLEVFTQDLSDVIDTVTNSISSGLTWIAGGIAAVPQEIYNDLIQPVIHGINAFFSGLWSGIASGVANMIQWLGTWVREGLATITGAVGNILGQINGWISSILGDIRSDASNIWAWIQNAGTNFSTWIWTGIQNAIPYITNAISGAFSWLQGGFLSLEQSVGQIFNSIMNGVTALLGNVQYALTSTLDFIGAGIRGDIAAISSFLGFVQTSLSNGFNALSAGIVGVADAAGTAVQDAISGAGSALSSLGNWIWNGIIDVIVNPMKAAFQWIGTTLQTGFNDVLTGIQTLVNTIASGDPNGATARAIEGILIIGGVITTAWVGATLLDALYPTKATGLQQLTGLLERIGGLGTLTAVVAGAITTVAFATPIQHELNATFRPALAPMGDLNAGYLRGLVDVNEYVQQMAYYGYNSQWTNLHMQLMYRITDEGTLTKALFWGIIQESDWITGLQQLGIGITEIQIKQQTRYRIPNVRIIQTLFLQGGISLQDLTNYLVREGYNLADQALLLGAYQLSQTQKATSEFYSVLRTGYKLGWLTETICRSTMAMIGAPQFEIDYRIQSFKLDYSITTNEDKKLVLKEAFEKSVIDAPTLTSSLLALNMEATKVADFVQYEVFKVMPKPKVTTTTATAS